jgi:predicted GIY-YIG superfamily endonuclease
VGTVYLLHLNRPLGHARHYLGYAERLEARLAHHRNGTGARFTQVLREQGIDWVVVHTWEGDRELERKLKRQHHSPRLCPLCNARAETNMKEV